MKKRLLFIPLHYNATPRPHEDWFNAFDKEFDAMYFSNDPAINTLICGFSLDYIFLQSGAISFERLESLKQYAPNAKVIQWTGDARAETMENVTQYKGIVDLTLLAVGIGQKEMYEKALGSPVGYLQQGVFESFFIDPKELQSGKIVFIGNNYNEFAGAFERGLLMTQLSLEFEQFEVIGNGFDAPNYNNTRSIPYIDSAKIYNESYISISHACFNDIEGYYSNRTLDIMASGGCCLMRYSKGAESWFQNNIDVVFYHSDDEAKEKIKWLIENPKERNRIAGASNRKARFVNTFGRRVYEIKQLIEKHNL